MIEVKEGITKKKHPMMELLITAFFLLLLTCLTYLTVDAIIRKFSGNSPALRFCQSEAFAGIIGCCFSAILLLTGLLDEPFHNVVERWKELGADFSCGLWKSGLRSYLYTLKEKGIYFWLYLALFGFEVFLIADGIRRFSELTGW